MTNVVGITKVVSPSARQVIRKAGDDGIHGIYRMDLKETVGWVTDIKHQRPGYSYGIFEMESREEVALIRAYAGWQEDDRDRLTVEENCTPTGLRPSREERWRVRSGVVTVR
jgi:hypothetical protein